MTMPKVSLLTGGARSSLRPGPQAPAPKEITPDPREGTLARLLNYQLAQMADAELAARERAEADLERERTERRETVAREQAEREAEKARAKAQRDAEAAERAAERAELERTRRTLQQLGEARAALEASERRAREAEALAEGRARAAEERARAALAQRPPAPTLTPAPRLKPEQIRMRYRRDELDYLREVVLQAEGHDDLTVVFEREENGDLKNLRLKE